MNKRFGAFSSSSDPDRLGDTVKGVIIALSTLIILVASWMGFEVGSEQVTNAAIIIGASISSVWTLYGLVKKIVVAVIARFNKE